MSKLAKVAPNAEWKTTWGAREAYKRGTLHDFRENPFLNVNQDFTHCNPESGKEAKEVACEFGTSL
jgi:hypothetical protein